jgi:hypothetical protein
MVFFIVIWALIGVGLGTYFSAFVLIPASVLCLIITGAVGVAEATDKLSIVIMMAGGMTMLHLGYLAGSFVHVMVIGNADDRSDEKHATMAHKLALGSDRSPSP